MLYIKTPQNVYNASLAQAWNTQAQYDSKQHTAPPPFQIRSSKFFQAETAHMAQIMYELLRRDSPYAVLEIRTEGSYDTAHLQSSEQTTHANFITKVSCQEVL